MKHTHILNAFILGVFVMASSHGQGTATDRSPYDDLLEATRFVQNYRETAEVSAKVFGARAQGSDKEYATFMAKVAKADLHD
jgi:glycosylphosphatidylinositol transamidase (GPIT) subunit GPI8